MGSLGAVMSGKTERERLYLEPMVKWRPGIWIRLRKSLFITFILVLGFSPLGALVAT
jgi:hypothetical protein